jgi:hypothetical protein
VSSPAPAQIVEPVVSPASVLADVARLARALDRCELRRRTLLAERAALVTLARSAGVQWPAIVAASGVSRQGLGKGL